MATKSALVQVQRSADRYYADHGWLKTYYSFSFAQYYDPNNLSWGALRVLNDDRIAPGRGFDTHPHQDMEIITYVLSGELEHKDSMGNSGVVGPGCVQFMSAGTGVAHSEYNHSAQQELHLIQMWVVPGRRGSAPSYGQVEFQSQQRLNRWLTVASGQGGRSAPISLTQDATFVVARLEQNNSQRANLSYRFAPGRLGFFFVADGSVNANGAPLETGDALRIAALEELTIDGHAEVLLWDLPPRA